MVCAHLLDCFFCFSSMRTRSFGCDLAMQASGHTDIRAGVSRNTGDNSGPVIVCVFRRWRAASPERQFRSMRDTRRPGRAVIRICAAQCRSREVIDDVRPAHAIQADLTPSRAYCPPSKQSGPPRRTQVIQVNWLRGKDRSQTSLGRPNEGLRAGAGAPTAPAGALDRPARSCERQISAAGLAGQGRQVCT
jgi:hypothetical protein